MTLRNGPDGYGVVTRVLHWSTVVLLLAQFTVGYLMEDSGGRGRGHGSGHGRGHGGHGSDFDGIDLLPVHVSLGALVLIVAIVRVGWRLGTALPPWDERLTPLQRSVAHRTEQVLLGSLFAVPLSGMVLLLSGEDDLLWVHVAAHLVLFAALAVHLVLVLGKRLLPRMV